MPVDRPEADYQISFTSTGGEVAVDKNKITRKRLYELHKLAFECANRLSKDGLERHELCVFGDIVRKYLEVE